MISWLFFNKNSNISQPQIEHTLSDKKGYAK